MFKIESYITPIILSYVDKYIKNLKPEDSQVSLWGGDAVFQNLDLRLDVLEQELGTPFSFVNGHIHELRIHVPWTKLGSEPVGITINTIECILKLSEDASSDRGSSTAEHLAASIKVRGEPKVAGKPPDATALPALPPPNYVQSLINRVINNISIICNNVILKYVEDDIVLSLNVKSVEVFAANNKWEKAFIDLSLPELILRKVIHLVDLTVCLDRRDASGKISMYQDPLLYRCSLDCRLHLAFESLYGNRLLATKLDILCDQLDFSVTDHQLTMFLRLIELGLALQADEITAAPTRVLENSETVEESTSSEAATEGWSSWLWSYVPSGISNWSDENSTDTKQTSSSVFHFGLYVKKASYMFKVEEAASDFTSGFSNRKVNFRPLCGLHVEAQYIDVVSRGLDVFNLKTGACIVSGVICGTCSCGVTDCTSSERQFFVAGGGSLDGKRESVSSHNLFIRDSLFDEESIENNGQHREYCFDWDQHFQIFSDEFIQEKTPAFGLDYFYLLEIPDDISEKSSGISVTDLENSNLKERTLVRILSTSPELDIDSSVVHRYQSIMASTSPYDYEPYAKQKGEEVVESNIPPTAEDTLILEKFIPYKLTRCILMQPLVKFSMASHSKSLEEAKCGLRKRNLKLSNELTNLEQLPKIIVTAKLLEIQNRTVLYPKRVVKIVSRLRTPSEYLMANSHQKFVADLRDGYAFVSHELEENNVQLPFIEPCNIIWKAKTLLLPTYWKSPVQPHSEFSIEVGLGTVVTTAPQLILLRIIWASWFEPVYLLKQLHNSSVMQDTFSRKSVCHGSKLRFKMYDAIWRQCQNNLLKCYTFTLGAASIEIENNECTMDGKCNQRWLPIFFGPQTSTAAHTLDFFKNISLPKESREEAKDAAFLHLTLQIPLDFDNIITPAAFLFNVRNSVICFDSRIFSWIAYRPFVHNTGDPLTSNFIPFNESLDNEGRSNESKGSEVSLGAAVTSTDASRTKSASRTTASCTKKHSQINNLGFLEFVARWSPVLQKLTIQIDFEGMHVFLCKNRISWVLENENEFQRNLVYDIRQMVINQAFPQSLVINFPLISMSNEGQKLSLNKVDIPISSINGSDKFPWSLRFERYSAFTLDNQDMSYLHAPNSVAATIAINSKSGHLHGSQLNVCVHCDFQPLNLHLSQIQAKLAVSIIKDHLSKGTVFVSMITQSGWLVLVPSVHSWPFTYEAPSSERKLKKSSRESTFIDKDITTISLALPTENEIKVSLWLQTTLPKLTFDIIDQPHSNIGIRVCIEMEDVTCSFDVQEIYSKIKLKVASVKAKNYNLTKDNWQLGDYGGVTFCSGQSGRPLYLTNTISLGSDFSHEVSSRSGDLPGSFLIATFTRVQRKNVQKRWAKLMRERSGGDDSTNQSAGIGTNAQRSRFISEIDLKLMPMEIVFLVPIFRCIANVSQPLLSLFPLSVPTRTDVSGTLPSLSTATLPLIYFSCSEVSVFFPHPSINESRELQGGRVENDLVVLKVHLCELTPNADNPISRIILKPDIFNVAQRAGILKIPGSVVEDRQYQVDVKGLSLSTGVWGQLVQSSNVQAGEMSQLTTMGENPAVEWNLKATSTSDVLPKTVLCPLFSNFDLRIVAAPAIVYEKGEFDFYHNDSVIAGHSLEVNVSTNVIIYCGLHQLDLLIKTISLIDSCYKNETHIYSNPADLVNKTLNRSLLEMDSGIDSEAVSSPGLLLGYPLHQTPLEVPPLLSPFSLGMPSLPLSSNTQHFVEETAFEVLLTAGQITFLSYFPEHYVSVPSSLQSSKCSFSASQLFASDGTKLRKRFQSPERKCQSTSSEEDGLKIRRSRMKNKVRDSQYLSNDPAIGYDGSVESSEEDTCVSDKQNDGIIPLFYVLISQPYSLVKFNKGSYKLELSCFDVNIRGVTVLRPIRCDAGLPKLHHYNATWLETVHGDPNSKTGIQPSLYTLTVVSQALKKPSVKLKIERPVKFIWDKWKMDLIDFLMANLNVLRTSNSISCSEPSTKSPWKKWICSVDSVQCSTKQIVLSIETPSQGVGDTRIIFSITDCSTVVSLQSQSLKNNDELTNATLSMSINGCLLKSQFLDPQPRSFIGPFSVVLESTVTWEKWATSQFLLMKLSLDTIFINVDKSHLRCINLVMDSILTDNTSNSDDLTSDFNWLPAFDGTSSDYHIWQDDLRVGIFQYTQNSDDSLVLPLIPGPNEIVFRSEKSGYGASMTWKYPEPRALVRTEIHPVPFRVAADDDSFHVDSNEKAQTEVSCALQYWNQLLRSFVTYRVFCLSETEPCILDLPSNLEPRRELVVSSTWRVLMNYYDNEGDADNESPYKRCRCAVSPLALAACMRVDSCFQPTLVPSLQFLFTVDLMKVTLRNSFHADDEKDTICSLAPFKLDGTMPSYQEFAIVTLENIKFVDQHWREECKAELEIISRVEVVDYNYLSLQPFMDSVYIRSKLLASCDHTRQKPYEIEISVNVDEIYLHLDPQSMFTLSSACQLWAKNDQVNEVYYLPCAYLICNNTLETIRFGQVDTDENIVLASYQVNAYAWRTAKTRQVIHICVEGMRWKWSEPFYIDEEGMQIIDVENESRKATLVVKVRQVNPVQKKIVISGLLTLANRLGLPLDIRIKNNTKSPVEEMTAVAPAVDSIPSFIVQVEDSWVLQLRYSAVDTNKCSTWSIPICLDSYRNTEPPMQIVDNSGKEINFWCKVFPQYVGAATRLLVVLYPLYIVRSHIPQSIVMEIVTPFLKEATTVITLEGKGKELHIYCPGQPNLQHNLKFRLNSESAEYSALVPLTLQSGNQLSQKSAELPIDIDAICENHSISNPCSWPYDKLGERDDIKKNEIGLDRSSVMVELSEMQLEISMKTRWIGCCTVLIDVKPWGLISNYLNIDCVLSFTKNSIEETIVIPAQSIVALPKLTMTVKLGIVYAGNVYPSGVISLTSYEQGWFTHKSTTCVHQHLDISVSTTNTKICFLTLSRMENLDELGIQIFTIRSRYSIANLSRSALNVLPMARSSNTIPFNVDVTNSLMVEPNSAQVELLLWEGAFRSGETSEDCVPHMIIGHSNEPSVWSIPTPLTSEEDTVGSRIDNVYSVVVPSLPNGYSTAYRISCQENQGSVVLLVTNDDTPQLHIHNRCPVPLYIAQGCSQSMDDGLDSVVAEEFLTTLVSELPIVDSFSSLYYTLPFVTQKFPQMYDPSTLPRLHLAEDSSKNGVGLEWSSGIQITSNADQFITIPNCGDVKVHIKSTSAITQIVLDPVNRIEITAQEIRSRIKPRVGENTQAFTSSGRKLSRSSKPTTPLPKWRTEEVEETSFIFRSPSRQNKVIGWSLYGSCHFSHICFVLCGNTKELIRVNVDHFQIVTRSVSGVSAQLKNLSNLVEQTSSDLNYFQEVIVCVGDLQIDNQLISGGGHDFPVVLLRQNEISKEISWSEISSARRQSLLTVSSIVQGSSAFTSKWLVKDVEINIMPIAIYAEDSLLYAIMATMKSVHWPHPPSTSDSITNLQPPSTIVVSRLTVHPISLLLSLRVSSKFFISFDHTPLNFKSFERTHVLTTWHRLGHTLAVHYMSGALVCAGWVIGSLDLLANPGGFARAVGTGVSDLFRLPYRGLMNGPWAFIAGIVQGTSSLISHIGSGTVVSITNLASSISRNMDYFSMDNVHLERNEELRRSPPKGFTAGLSQGLTGFGISLLGAMAGIVHQPLQSIHEESTERPITHTAAGILSGVGKGLVGIVVKPIGGAAEFVAQAGQGILHGAGWIRVHKPRYEPIAKDLRSNPNSLLKYVWKMLSNSPSELILAVEATNVNAGGNYIATSLLLTSEVLFVVSLDSDSQQQAFGLAELDCRGSTEDPTLISFFSKELTEDGTQGDNKQSDRVAEFVDRTSKYTAKGNLDRSQRAIIDESESSSSTCSSPSSYQTNPWNSKTQVAPTFNFYLHPRLRDTFLACYTSAQRKILGKGFN